MLSFTRNDNTLRDKMKQPLADRIRPEKFEEIVGQDHLLGAEGVITHFLKHKRLLSIVLWGPPGCGKTTLARLYAQAFEAHFVTFSAVLSGIADLRKVVKEAKNCDLFRRHTVLFVDEIHRFNKAQQDAFLPFLEDGTITLVGATTENPSFALNNALLSRVQVLTLHSLDNNALMNIIRRYEAQFHSLPLTDDAKMYLIQLAQGDGRYLLNLIEALEGESCDDFWGVEALKKLLQKRAALFDKAGDGHYNLISALHKSIRGSDPDAALYWFARMLEGGEDPLYIGRRLIRMATEDIGLADPTALSMAVTALKSFEILGSPEGELSFAQVVVYLALAPKSNAVYKAFNIARELAGKGGHLPPPKVILNAPSSLMKVEGYGQGYLYDHDTPHCFSGQNYFPDGMDRLQAYQPVERGFEREMKKRMDYFSRLREKNLLSQ